MKTVIEMAREAGWHVVGGKVVSPLVSDADLAWLLARFAAIVSTGELDKTLKILDDLFKHDRKESGYDEGWNDALGVAAKLIEELK